MDSDKNRLDAAAAAKVFLDHKDFIREVIWLRIRDEDQADDLFQDFFLSLVSNPPPASIQNIESYLYKAIAHDIIDAIHRKEKYRNCIQEYRECSNRPRRQKTPEQAVLMMEEINKVFRLIERRLPRTEARAVCLQYRDSHTAKEMAEQMGVGMTTARGYVSEGLSRIRRLLSVESGVKPGRA